MAPTIDELIAQGYTVENADGTPVPAEIQSLLAKGYTMGDAASDSGASFLDTVGQYAKAGARGVQNLYEFANPFSHVSDISSNLTERVTGTHVPTEGEIADAYRKQYVGDPKFETAAGRYAGAAVEAAPSAILGGGLIPALFSGVGSEAAKDLGYSPMLGALFGGGISGLTWGGIKDAGRAFVGAGRKQIAGEMLKAAAGEQGVKNIMAGADNAATDFGTKTFGEIAQTPTAANLESALKKEIVDGNPILLAQADRQAKRIAALQDMSPDPLGAVAPYERGALIKKEATPIAQEADNAQRAAWDTVGMKGQLVDATGAAMQVANMADKLEGYLGFSKDAKKVLAGLAGDGEPGSPRLLTAREFQNLRSDAGQVMDAASSLGKGKEASVMREVRDSLDSAADYSVKQGLYEGNELTELRSAIDQTKKYKTTFGDTVAGSIVTKGGNGLNPENIPKGIITSPTASKEFMAAFGESPSLVGQAKAQLLDTVTKGDKDSWINVFKNNTTQLKTVFGDDFDKVKNVIDDLTSEQSVGKLNQMATGRGSITGQTMSTANWIAGSFPKLVLEGTKKLGALGGSGAGSYVFGIPGFVVGTAGGLALQKLATFSEIELKKLLVNSMADPKLAKLLIETARPEPIARVLHSLAGSAVVGIQAKTRQGREALSQKVASQGDAQTKDQAAKAQRSIQSNSLDLSAEETGQEQLGKQVQNKSGLGLFAITTPSVPSPKAAEALGGQERSTRSLSSLNPASYSPTTQAPIDTAFNRMKSESNSMVDYTDLAKKIAPAVIRQESNGRANVVSDKGAIGLMQIKPSTAAEVAKGLGMEDFDLKKPADNKKIGTAYLAQLLEKYAGDVGLALTAYHTGLGTVDRLLKENKATDLEGIIDDLGPVGKKYAKQVMARLDKLGVTTA